MRKNAEKLGIRGDEMFKIIILVLLAVSIYTNIRLLVISWELTNEKMYLYKQLNRYRENEKNYDHL